METNNMNIRERFEEIWPVPDVIMWSDYIGRYIPMPDEVLQYERLNEQWAHEHNARLDTFTRCQETTADIDRALAGMLFAFDDGVGREWSEDLLDYARKLVAAKEYVK